MRRKAERACQAEGTACAKCLNQGPVRELARVRLAVRGEARENVRRWEAGRSHIEPLSTRQSLLKRFFCCCVESRLEGARTEKTASAATGPDGRRAVTARTLTPSHTVGAQEA